MVDEATLKLARQMLGYTDAQWEIWKKNPQEATRIAFNKAHCVDVGVDAGGWGAVVVELRVEKT